MGDKIFVVGYRDVDFKDKDGRAVSGRSYYFTCKSDGVIGDLAGKLFVPTKTLIDLPFTPQPGDEVYVYYNRFGKPQSFQRV